MGYIYRETDEDGDVLDVFQHHDGDVSVRVRAAENHVAHSVLLSYTQVLKLRDVLIEAYPPRSCEGKPRYYVENDEYNGEWLVVWKGFETVEETVSRCTDEATARAIVDVLNAKERGQ
jgi:hypothetical protein